MKKIFLIFAIAFIINLALSQTKEVEMPTIDEIEQEAEKLASEQLEAYNNRDIEKFLLPFSDSVEVYEFPDKLMYNGKEKMMTRYKTMFENSPKLNCKLTNRTVLGNTVIDSEEVIGIIPNELVKAVAIYTIENHKIQKVHFIRQTK